MKNPVAVGNRKSAVQASAPWRAMAELENEMSRWFENRLGAFQALPLSTDGVDFYPLSDLQETDREFVLRIEIPGIEKQNVKIEVQGDTLIVRGERVDENEGREGRRHYSEFSYGSFMRRFTLSERIEEAKVKATCADGVLKVTVPKSEKSTARVVAIQ